jgi:hypothetical protein
MQTNTGDYYNILPSRTLKIKLDKQDVVTENTIRHVSSSAPSEFTVSVQGNYLQKNGLAILDLIVTNRWQRPIYFNYTSLNTVGIDFNSHVIQEGNLYRLVPYENTGEEIMVDTSATYKILVEDSDYSNLANDKVYFNYEDYQARIITPLRQSFNSLAAGFLAEGNADMAKKTLQFAVKKLYPRHLEPSYTNLQAADILFSLGSTHDAKELSSSLFEFHFETVLGDIRNGHQPERLALYLVTQSAEILNQLGETQYLVKVNDLQTSAMKPF